MNSKLLWIIAFAFAASEIHAQTFQKANVSNISLYPQQNELRNTLNISGVWKYQKDSLNVGEKEQWYNGLNESRPIAVPGSYNEQYEDLMNYFGYSWYEQTSYIPKSWDGQRVFLRFGAANYASKVWVNGKPVGTHLGGRLPFAFEISDVVEWNKPNRITIQIEAFLKPDRVPVGGKASVSLFNNNPPSAFDFFPYAGLQRPVWLYSVPKNYIKDIAVVTEVDETDGVVKLKVEKSGNLSNSDISIEGNNNVYSGKISFRGDVGEATIQIPNARLWNLDDPYLYNLSVSAGSGKKITDKYSLPIGIRTVSTNNKAILLNGKPVFLKGFGKHEDFPVIGKGTAYPVIVKDYSLLKWIGANSYRTSHYPYDEEYMNMADREGILIIDEIPAVGLFFDQDTAGINTRKRMAEQQIHELITRDKNHPSVIAWSVANEPLPENRSILSGVKPKASQNSIDFFKELYQTAKVADPSRLVTFAGVGGGPDEWLGIFDIVSINRYYGWYSETGDIAAGAKVFSKELDDLHAKFNKPILVTEFGADAYPGFHSLPPEMFSEEYQRDFIKAYLDVADAKDFVTGMHVWAFADFKTAQGIIRFGGMNWKGVFTRDRKPKMAAHYLHQRWKLGKK